METRDLLVVTRETLPVRAPQPACEDHGPPTHSEGTREADDE